VGVDAGQICGSLRPVIGCAREAEQGFGRGPFGVLGRRSEAYDLLAQGADLREELPEFLFRGGELLLEAISIVLCSGFEGRDGGEVLPREVMVAGGVLGNAFHLGLEADECLAA